MIMLDGLVLQNNGVPIYVQLRDQLAAAIGRGELKPGMRLPSTREVAATLAVDLNTVHRAYAALQEEGLLTAVQGRGSFVAALRGPPRNRAAGIKLLAARVAAQAQAAGISVGELADALRNLSGRGS
jgi:GntR family transcriptional regulator